MASSGYISLSLEFVYPAHGKPAAATQLHTHAHWSERETGRLVHVDDKIERVETIKDSNKD
jgi:hypothetical protein